MSLLGYNEWIEDLRAEHRELTEQMRALTNAMMDVSERLSKIKVLLFRSAPKPERKQEEVVAEDPKPKKEKELAAAVMPSDWDVPESLKHLVPHDPMDYLRRANIRAW